MSMKFRYFSDTETQDDQDDDKPLDNFLREEQDFRFGTVNNQDPER